MAKDKLVSDAYRCPLDGLPCHRFIVEFGFGACIARDSNGKLLSVCSRYSVKSGFSTVRDKVPMDLIPK